MNQRSTIALLQNLYFSESKPAELRPIDLALLTYLVLRQTEDHFIFDSQLTLADRLGCKRDAIADSVKRLEGLGWIVVQRPWQFSTKTKRKTRVIGKTVDDRAKRSKPSRDAVDMARLAQQAGTARPRLLVVSDDASFSEAFSAIANTFPGHDKGAKPLKAVVSTR